MSLSAAVLISGLLASTAPYVRTRAEPGGSNTQGAELYWPNRAITFRQSSAGNAQNDGDEFSAISRAWDTWRFAAGSCSDLTFIEGSRVAGRTVGYDKNNPSSNQNVILFRSVACSEIDTSNSTCGDDGSCGNLFDCWDYSPQTIALTTNTYDVNNGKIYDADVEFNSAHFYFTTVDSPPCNSDSLHLDCVAYDIQNAMTHEAGHFLGLDHTDHANSTMNPTAPVGETSKRAIDSGTKSFLCDVYPKPDKGGCAAPGAAGLGVEGMGLVIAWLAVARRRGGGSGR